VLTLLLWAALTVVVAAVLFVVIARVLPAGEQIAPAVRDEPPWELPPDRSLTAEDVDQLRLPVALRGYRFAETDLLLDRVAEELRLRDAEIARLREFLNPRPLEVSTDPARPE
jgi:DivIVA domain-containing protein